MTLPTPMASTTSMTTEPVSRSLTTPSGSGTTSSCAASVVSERAGDLVCKTAGHHMEAMLAAYGSGAVRASHERALRLLNVDIGGGTTKLTLIDSGRVTATAAFHVGGRLIAAHDGVVT